MCLLRPLHKLVHTGAHLISAIHDARVYSDPCTRVRVLVRNCSAQAMAHAFTRAPCILVCVLVRAGRAARLLGPLHPRVRDGVCWPCCMRVLRPLLSAWLAHQRYTHARRRTRTRAHAHTRTHTCVHAHAIHTRTGARKHTHTRAPMTNHIHSTRTHTNRTNTVQRMCRCTHARTRIR